MVKHLLRSLKTEFNSKSGRIKGFINLALGIKRKRERFCVTFLVLLKALTMRYDCMVLTPLPSNPNAKQMFQTVKKLSNWLG